MRQQNHKKIRNQPMRSPSPDFATKNSIKNTTVNTQHVYRYIDNKHGNRSRSPRYSNHNDSYNVEEGPINQIQRLKKKIRELEQKNHQLWFENQGLKSQPQTNEKFQDELASIKETERSRRSSVKQYSPQNSSRKSLNQFKDKIGELVGENQRLQNKILEKDKDMENLIRENEENQKMLMLLKNQKKNPSSLSNLQFFYNNSIQNLLNEKQKEWSKKFEQLERKIFLLGNVQENIKDKMKERREPSKILSSQQSKKQSFIYEPPQKSYNPNAQEENKQLANHIKYLQKQIQNLRKKCFELEDELTKEKFKPSQQILKEKLKYSEEQLRKKMHKILEMEDLLQAERGKHNSQINQYKIELDQEKRKNNDKNIEKYYENQIQKVKDYYSQLMKEKQKNIAHELESYLYILRNLKSNLQEANRDEYAKQTPQLENNSIEKQLQLIKEENQKIISELKKKLIFQEQRIIQLEKQNRILRNEVNQLNIQKQKLQKSMMEFDQIKMITTELPRSRSGCRMKGCLKDTIEKIDTLETKITKILQD